MANFRTKITQSNIKIECNGEKPTLLRYNGNALKQIRIDGVPLNDYKMESNVRVNISLRAHQLTSWTGAFNLSSRWIHLDGVSISDNSISGYNATTDISIIRYALRFRYTNTFTATNTGTYEGMYNQMSAGGDTVYLLSGSYLDVKINGVERRITLSGDQNLGGDNYGYGDTYVNKSASFSGIVSYTSA